MIQIVDSIKHRCELIISALVPLFLDTERFYPVLVKFFQRLPELACDPNELSELRKYLMKLRRRF
jgi:hypothetical protein